MCFVIDVRILLGNVINHVQYKFTYIQGLFNLWGVFPVFHIGGAFANFPMGDIPYGSVRLIRPRLRSKVKQIKTI